MDALARWSKRSECACISHQNVPHHATCPRLDIQLQTDIHAQNVWPDLSWCTEYSPCQILQVLMGWAWLGWLCLTFLFIPTLWIVAAARNWDNNCFDTWNYDHAATIQPGGGGRRVPDTGTGTDIGLLPTQPVSKGPLEKSMQSRVEREVLAREQVWNLEKEAAKMRARLNSWIGHRRQSRAAVDLEHGGPHLYNNQVHTRKSQGSTSLAPSPPLPPNGALRLNVEGTEAHKAP
jgi:hypothetical protein